MLSFVTYTFPASDRMKYNTLESILSFSSVFEYPVASPTMFKNS